MVELTAAIPQTYSGTVNSGTPGIANVPFSVPSLSCGDITNTLPTVNGSYPVDCDFVTLFKTGTVFFMDPSNQQLTLASEVSVSVSSGGLEFTEQGVEDFWSIYTMIVCFCISVAAFIRFLKKLPNGSYFFD